MKIEPFEPENYYQLFNRGNNKENLFKKEENYFYFISLMKKYLSPINDIYAYCLLLNHFYILLKIKDKPELPIDYTEGEKRISQPFSNVIYAYAKAINKRYNRTGSLFQEHLLRIKVESEIFFFSEPCYICSFKS